jgi:putative ABC transport system ATP-binding protein
MIKLKNLVKTYKMGSTTVKALDGINLEVADGTFITIMGRSGSGKTTLLNMIGCLDRPDNGTIIIDGADITKLPRRQLSKIRREKIGFIFQQHNLIDTLTALENVMLPLRYVRVPKKKAKALALKLLIQVGLQSRINHLPKQLSGGEQQRVAIARALVNKPVAILGDEPTGSIDTETAQAIVALMRKLSKKNNQTFIVVTHDPIIAAASDLVVKMIDGKLYQEDKLII